MQTDEIKRIGGRRSALAEVTQITTCEFKIETALGTAYADAEFVADGWGYTFSDNHVGSRYNADLETAIAEAIQNGAKFERLPEPKVDLFVFEKDYS